MKITKKLETNNNKFVIEYNEKKYAFSTRSLILFPIGTIALATLLIFFFDLKITGWINEVTAKSTVFLLNAFFNMGAYTLYVPTEYYPWYIIIPNNVQVYITSGCSGTPAISIFSAFIIFTPHSIDLHTSRDIIKRKIKDIILTVCVIYIFNIFRLLVVLYFYHQGIPWEIIHDSLANLSAVVAVHVCIFYLGGRLIPEWYISIYYAVKLIYTKLWRNGIKKKKI